MTNTLTGRVVYAPSATTLPFIDWKNAVCGFNAAYDYEKSPPKAVVYCQDENDIVNAVRYAIQEKLPFALRSGRHNYQGYSSLVPGGIIIDVNDIEIVRYDAATQTVDVGAGVSMLEMTELLADVGVTLPLATGPSVGIAGLTLGGGFGLTSRLFGLTCDHLVSAKMVNANGDLIQVSDTQEPDLFWALRGSGGGNFGAVTEFKFRTHPVFMTGAFNVEWRWDDFENVVDRWQNWAVDEAPDGITSLLSLKVDKTITLLGLYTVPVDQPGNVFELPAILAPMLAAAPPTVIGMRTIPYVAAARLFFGVDPLHPTWQVREHSGQQIFKSSSAFAYENLPSEAIVLLRKQLENVPPLSAPANQPSMIQLLSGGGQVRRVPAEATAAYHRQARFVVQYDGYWTAEQDRASTTQWVSDTRTQLARWTRGAYVNYQDDQLSNPLYEYYDKNLARLKQIKQQYDPYNVFRFPQSIP